MRPLKARLNTVASGTRGSLLGPVMAKTSAEARARAVGVCSSYVRLLGRRFSDLGVGGDSRKDDVVAALSSLSFASLFRDSFGSVRSPLAQALRPELEHTLFRLSGNPSPTSASVGSRRCIEWVALGVTAAEEQ